jgi:hypothetical protein
MKSSKIVYWLLRLVPAVILLQTLFFKFTGAEVSRWIFTQMHMEPWGRIGTGIGELIAAILLLWPRRSGFGALLSLGLMAGALFAHLFVIGINVQNDGGKVFVLAIITFMLSAVVLLQERNSVTAVFFPSKTR